MMTLVATCGNSDVAYYRFVGSSPLDRADRGDDDETSCAPSPWHDVRDLLRARGLRWTPQRRSLIDVLARTDGHLSGAEILRRCREADPLTTPSTVYRTLDVLELLGLVRHGHGQDGTEEYHVLPAGEHGHLYCSSCGRGWDLEPSEAKQLVGALARERGFEVDLSHVTVVGRCEDCRRAARADDPSSGGRRRSSAVATGSTAVRAGGRSPLRRGGRVRLRPRRRSAARGRGAGRRRDPRNRRPSSAGSRRAGSGGRSSCPGRRSGSPGRSRARARSASRPSRRPSSRGSRPPRDAGQAARRTFAGDGRGGGAASGLRLGGRHGALLVGDRSLETRRTGSLRGDGPVRVVVDPGARPGRLSSGRGGATLAMLATNTTMQAPIVAMTMLSIVDAVDLAHLEDAGGDEAADEAARRCRGRPS